MTTAQPGCFGDLFIAPPDQLCESSNTALVSFPRHLRYGFRALDKGGALPFPTHWRPPGGLAVGLHNMGVVPDHLTAS
jgi:hypothetical protein